MKKESIPNPKGSLLITLMLISVINLPGNNPINRAMLHPIEYHKPAIDFFEGALLGNGGLGVVVTTRPDAICLHFGHNNVWDIRVAENNREKTGTFAEIFEKVKSLPENLKIIWDDPDFSQYLNMTADNYRKPYPRPFPCGTLILGFDRRRVELLGHKIDISTGLCEIYLLNEDKPNTLQIFVSSNEDEIWFRLTDGNNQLQPSCFNRLRILPDPYTPQDIPHYEIIDDQATGEIGFYQTLPYLEPHLYNPMTGHPKDKAFSLTAKINTGLIDGIRHTNQGLEEPLKPLEKYIRSEEKPFVGTVVLNEGLKSIVKKHPDINSPSNEAYNDVLSKTKQSWSQYWSRSGIELEDDFLEKIWYWNLYFLNCSVKEGITCPGIFANWSYGNIGTAWHGDYHLNYNTQQPFWVTFSSNHLNKNLPYVDLVYHLLPISKQWAKEYYNMRGAFFPHSAYPVDMTLHPYPVPDWGWEVFETPWAVQGLWWHYLYSMDEQFLKEKAFEPIKEAVLFLVDYMTRPDAHGEKWDDHKYHIFPSVPPELYGLQPGFKFNYDTQIDITLAKFVFNAYLKSVEILGYSTSEEELTSEVKQILPNLPDYSTTVSTKYGTIYTSVPGENEHIVYNVPANLTLVFPGEEFGIDAPDVVYERLINTCNAHQNEGGNDIVLLNMQAARLGILDIEKFKRQIKYALLPNKTVTDILLQTGGRYDDQTDFAYMTSMGIWFENFALPAVINECLMQSYDGTIRLFPNWDKNKDATFSSLRAAGAFLVDCKLSAGEIIYVNLLSEQGKICNIANPWGNNKVKIIRNGIPSGVLEGNLFIIKTKKGEKIQLQKHNF